MIKKPNLENYLSEKLLNPLKTLVEIHFYTVLNKSSCHLRLTFGFATKKKQQQKQNRKALIL